MKTEKMKVLERTVNTGLRYLSVLDNREGTVVYSGIFAAEKVEEEAEFLKHEYTQQGMDCLVFISTAYLSIRGSIERGDCIKTI